MYTRAHNLCVWNPTKQKPIILDSKTRSKFNLKFELYSLFLKILWPVILVYSISQNILLNSLIEGEKLGNILDPVFQ